MIFRSFDDAQSIKLKQAIFITAAIIYPAWGELASLIISPNIIDSFFHRKYAFLIGITGYALTLSKYTYSYSKYLVYPTIYYVWFNHVYLLLLNNSSISYMVGLITVSAVTSFLIQKKTANLVYVSISQITTIALYFNYSQDSYKYLIAHQFSVLAVSHFTIRLIVNYREESNRREIQMLQEKQKLTYLNEVAAQAAHDIKSPFNAILAITKQLDENKNEYSDILLHATSRISNISDHLLNASKLVFTNDNVTKITINKLIDVLDHILKEKSFEYGHKASIKQIANTKCSQPETVFVKIDIAIFKRIISNVINNSIESQKNNYSQIIVETEYSINSLKIEITDNGNGFPSEIINSNSLAQFKTTKDKGTGIGLFFAKTKIENWGGEFAIRNHPDGGAVIEIRLPVITAHEQDSDIGV